MLKHHTSETLTATAILLACGGALTLLSHRWGVGGDLMSQLGAVAGPVGVVLGLGMAIHGRAMPPTHITFPARVWGLLGSVAAFANLWSLGYFERGGRAGIARWLLPAGLVGAWLLPRRFYGEEAPTIPVESPGTASLSGLLDGLESVGEAHPELFDTDVRERLWTVIERRYVQLDSAYEIPSDLGMFSDEGNARLRTVLHQHVGNLVAIAEAFQLDTEAKRLQSFQNPDVKSAHQGLTYDAFFGAP